jgi:Glycosyltransferase like family 2
VSGGIPAAARGGAPHAEYVLPLRWTSDEGLDELTAYLRRIAERMPVTVVDGSPELVFARHAARWRGFVRHVPPEPWPGRNGKVAGVLTGVLLARAERVVLADDDVRYDDASLDAVIRLLDFAEVVRPQNYFSAPPGQALPWHARHDTARSLVNRAFASDYPGTFALRRSALFATGGYDGDVLFENLELLRTIRASGGREVRADGVYVRRLPPTLRHFAGQRVRQAYDDFAQPARLGVELSLLPLLIWAARRPLRLLPVAGAAIAVAEVGRRRAGGTEVFPATAALWAPAWLAERAVAVWLALGSRLRGGVPYGGARILRAGTPMRVLRRKLSQGGADDES